MASLLESKDPYRGASGDEVFARKVGYIMPRQLPTSNQLESEGETFLE
jgi:hypothetical protein